MLHSGINLERSVGQLDLETAQRLTDSGRDTLLTLATPMEEEWNQGVLEHIAGLLLDPPIGIPAVGQPAFSTELYVRRGEGLMESRMEPGLDARGRRHLMTRTKPIEGWYLARSLAADVAELGFAEQKPIAAIGGRYMDNVDASSPTRNRLDIYQELVSAIKRGRSSTRLSALEAATGITNASAHIDDLELLGIVDRTETIPEKRYRVVAGVAEDEVQQVLAISRGPTKERTLNLRRVVYELCAATDRSVNEIATQIERRGLEQQLYLPTEDSKERRSRIIGKQLAWLKDMGLLERLEGDEDPRNQLRICVSGLLVAIKYLHILQAHSHATESQIRDNARAAAVSDELATYLAYSDYALGKFKVAFSEADKEQMIAQVVEAKDRPVTVAEIHDAIQGVLSPQVIRKHLADSDRFSVVGTLGSQNLYA